MSLSLKAQELKMHLEAISHAIEQGENEDAIKSKTLPVFTGWAQGAYGSGFDTDLFILCPRTTDGKVMLEDNYDRAWGFLLPLGASQGVLVLEATLKYSRKGLERPVKMLDKDTIFEQRYTLKDVRDTYDNIICAVSTTNKSAVFPHNFLDSRPLDDTHSEEVASGGYGLGTIEEVYLIPAVALIPEDRLKRALNFEKEIMDSISSLKADDPEWQLPAYLEYFSVEADCVHLLEILDISVTRGKVELWEKVMEILLRFKSASGVGASRIFAATEVFSFEKVQPFLSTLIAQFTTVEDVSSFIAEMKYTSKENQDTVHRWCADQGDERIMKILSSDEKTIPSLVHYSFVKGLPLLSNLIKSLSEANTVSFTFWVSLINQLDRHWRSLDSPSSTGAPVHEICFMLDGCIAAMTPLVGQGAVYTPVPPHHMHAAGFNAGVHVRRTITFVEICLRFSSLRCGDVLSDIFKIPGDVQVKFDLFLHPLARGLHSLLNQYGLTIFHPPFILFYRSLVWMCLGFCLGDDRFTHRDNSWPARMVCTEKVVCNHCEFIERFLSSATEIVVTDKEWSLLEAVFPKLKDKVFSPTLICRDSLNTVRIDGRPRLGVEAAKEFLQTIGNEEEISKLMEPLAGEVEKVLKGEEPFDFDLWLKFLPPFV